MLKQANIILRLETSINTTNERSKAKEKNKNADLSDQWNFGSGSSSSECLNFLFNNE